jgi:TPR repeat protein
MRPPPRQYDSRGPPQGGWQSQAQGGLYDQGYQDYGSGLNGYPGSGDGYGSGPQDRYANTPAHGAQGPRPRPSRPGYGPPPPDNHQPARGYPPNGARGYDNRGYGGPGGGSRPPPPNGRGGPMNRPPPQRMRQPPPVSPETGSWDNPFPSFPASQPLPQRGSEERGLTDQMAGLDLQDQSQTSRPPERPHTSHTTRPERGPPNGRPYAAGRGMPPSGYAGPGDRPYMANRAAPPMGGPKRSATNPLPPTFATPAQGNPQYPVKTTYQEPVPTEDYSDLQALAPPRPSTAGGSRPTKVTDRANVYSTYASDHELLSHYFEPGDNEEGDELDMPNFDAMPNAKSGHQRGTSIDNHLTPSSEQSPQGGSIGAYAPYKPEFSSPATVPNEFESFQFDLPQEPSGPARSGSVNSGGYGPRPYGGPTQGNGPPRPYRGNQPGVYDDMSNGTGIPSVDENPDALPSHPTPFRAGLDQGPKPPPVRQYNNNVPAGPAPAPQGAAPTLPGDRPQSGPVTHEELQRLQQMVRDKPTDYKTQLILAKKLVEASSVLIGEEGRVDPKTRNKNREKYVMDAYKMVKKLVHAGYPDAMFYLADCYGQGLLGLEVDAKEAFALYQSAAKAGHSESAYRTAVCCELGMEDGGGTKRDALKSVQWYRRAAALGNTPAMYKMGIILLKGLLGQQRNPREALTWLKRAAERADEENPHALHELGLLYESTNNNDFIVRDEEYSKQLFTQAAELGYKFSQFRLGAAYEYGLMGCTVDARQSIIWYTRAAAQGEHQSELALSGWYLTGAEGILQQSDTEAYLWARKAAAAGLPKAEYAMGYFTEVGIGVPSNLEDAKRWYWRAACK